MLKLNVDFLSLPVRDLLYTGVIDIYKTEGYIEMITPFNNQITYLII